MRVRILELIAAPENLLAAWRVVRGNVPKYRRKRAAGPDGVSLFEFEKDLTTQLRVLRDMLLKGRYQPQPPAYFSVPKRGGGERLLAILPVRDRVAQRAAQQVLEPVWEPDFLPCSFGFRPGISIHHAVTYVESLRTQNGWVVDGDIASCFDTINHDLLMHLVKRKIRDARVLDLIQRWLDVGIMQAGPPQNIDMQFARRIESAKNFARKSFDWLLESFGTAAVPYGYSRYSYDDYAYYPNNDFVDQTQDKPGSAQDAPVPYGDPFPTVMKRMAIRQMLSSGLTIGLGFLRTRASSIFNKTGMLLQMAIFPPSGRRLLKKSAVASGSLAGLAAAAAVTAYFLNRKAGPSPTGILQGSPLSPLLANVYLHPFDVNLTQAGHQLARFADDWIILCPSQDRAENAYNEALRSLAKLHLKANVEKTRIVPPGEQLEWLGVVLK